MAHKTEGAVNKEGPMVGKGGQEGRRRRRRRKMLSRFLIDSFS